MRGDGMEEMMRLREFHWEGDNLEFGHNLHLRRHREPPDLSRFTQNLSPREVEESAAVSHWLHFDWNEGDEPDASASANLFLFSLWLAKPTRAHIDFRFWWNRSGDTSGSARLLDRFSYLPEQAGDRYSTEELRQASELFAILTDMYVRQGRLSGAVVIAISGCWSHFWQAALLCHAGSLEALLTYAINGPITRRLAKSYACLVETEKAPRDAAFREFCEIYDARSDVIHGRAFQIAGPVRLPTLNRLQDVLRKLLLTVCNSPELRNALEGSDDVRQAFLINREAGYEPPVVRP